ncbi:LexA-binding, inner membrane-associated putative hydrolase [Halogranum amylolyticum]|uniref:LexA-binding, inner membrane-associated putative hydrolase n=1 Tax=Halogranum amylolyticum TaxID=660520 RepID=A0A1H8RSU8_9EURY|nr:metal-dependent hydrolase [Halogranum amylolyticum]SEO69406.1 LexA-binding, inner membrane-associated putative hydrolase [Halogranum amylolyticum]
MFVGHALLAFAVAASVAAFTGWPRERALSVGLVAGLFAAAPDVDMAYALVGVATASVGNALALAGAFWQTGNLVHRAVTHSLVVALFVSLSVGLVASGVRAASLGGRRRRASRLSTGGGLLLSTALVVAAGAKSGLLGAVVMGLFCAVSLGIALVAVRRTELDACSLAAAALFGVASHPFGDLFTGEPPALLYPLDAVVFADRLTLHADPTVHLLSAFGLELATIWAAVLVGLWLTGRSLRTAVDARAALGVGYAGSLLVIPAPTLDLSYPFVFTVLAVGAVGATPRFRRSVPSRRLRRPTFELPERLSAAVTGLAAVTLGWVAYSLAYLLA